MKKKYEKLYIDIEFDFCGDVFLASVGTTDDGIDFMYDEFGW